MLLLNEAAQVTGLDRMGTYGDPLFNFEGVAKLKRAFWSSLPEITGDDIREQNTAAGHAIDMMLMKMGRLATSPAGTIQKDNILDLCCYAAILYEIAAKADKVDA